MWEGYSKPVPYIVLACCHWLSLAGLQSVGIFRADSSQASVDKLTARFVKDPTTLLPVGCDPLEVASVLKHYLRYGEGLWGGISVAL